MSVHACREDITRWNDVKNAEVTNIQNGGDRHLGQNVDVIVKYTTLLCNNQTFRLLKHIKLLTMKLITRNHTKMGLNRWNVSQVS